LIRRRLSIHRHPMNRCRLSHRRLLTRHRPWFRRLGNREPIRRLGSRELIRRLGNLVSLSDTPVIRLHRPGEPETIRRRDSLVTWCHRYRDTTVNRYCRPDNY